MGDREKFVEQARSWVGAKEPDNKYREIIKTFESNKKHLKYDGQGCCEFTVACAIKAFGVDQKYIPVMNYANGQSKMWKKLEKTPSVGSLAYFDYQDGMGISHVEIVADIYSNTLETVDGNANHKVIVRKRNTHNQDIVGFGTPVWKEEYIDLNEYVKAVNGTLQIRLNCKGSLVLWLQKYLQANGFYKEGILDGVFGGYMRKETLRWQRSVGLTPDGWFGENAFNYITSHLK